jgi:predicted AlkP superfamily phosphohydrolase/phosphomutase
VEVFEYGCHDRHFGFNTWPPESAREIAEKFGLHPVFTVDPYSEWHLAPDDYAHRAASIRTQSEETALLRDMLEGLERKRRLSTSILSGADWDLFVSVFGESHAIGHQSWHLHDRTHPRHDCRIASAVGDPVEKVYVALDRVLGDHLEIVPRDATKLVLLTHGMGPHYDGTHLLEEVLSQLNLFGRRGFGGRAAVRAAKTAWSKVPVRWREICAPMIAHAVSCSMGKASFAPCSDKDIGPQRRASRRFFLSPNNSVYGGIRINLAGREPAGLVEPGLEYEMVCDQLRRDLLELINIDTAEPAIRAVERTERYYAREATDELPDLIIEWNRNAPIETVWSAKTGTVHARYPYWRTGDHRPAGHLFISGPEFVDGAALDEIFIGDLGPTICAMLGHKLTGVAAKPIERFLRRNAGIGSA